MPKEKCDFNELFIEQLSDRELDYMESAEVAAHIKSCPVCQRKYEDIADVKKMTLAFAENEKLSLIEKEGFNTIFYFDFKMNKNTLEEKIRGIFRDPKCGSVHRIKGITQNDDGAFYEVNATAKAITFKKVTAERAIMIVIGEDLNKASLVDFLGEPTL